MVKELTFLSLNGYIVQWKEHSFGQSRDTPWRLVFNSQCCHYFLSNKVVSLGFQWNFHGIEFVP